MPITRKYSSTRTFSSEALAAAATATSVESSRTSSLVRSKSAPRHTQNFRRTNSMMSNPESRREHRRINSYGSYERTFSTSVIPTNYDENQTIDTNLAFDNFDGGIDDIIETRNLSPQRRYRHISNRGTQVENMNPLEVVEKYVPGPRGLSIVQVPVLKQPSQKPKKDYTQSTTASPRRRVSTISSPKREPLSPNALKRHGAVRRSNIVHSSEEAQHPVSPRRSLREVEPTSPRDFHATYEDDENRIEKTVTTRQTKDHGSVETTTIVRRHTKREPTPDLPESNHNASNTKANVLKLRDEVKKSEFEKNQLELKLENIINAEKTLGAKKENQNIHNVVRNEIPIPVAIPKHQHDKLKGPIRVVSNMTSNTNTEEGFSDEGSFNDDNESTSIVSSMATYDHLSTIQSIDVEPPKQDIQPETHELPRDTSNQDIKILNGKLNAFLDKEIVEDKNDKGNNMFYESLLMNMSTTESIPGMSSRFNSNISLDPNDSQISVVPSLDLGQNEHQKNKTQDINTSFKMRHNPSMAQYLKASHPYLISSDEETETNHENNTYLSIDNANERRTPDDTDSNIDSTLSLNIPHDQVPTSSYTSVDSHSKGERTLSIANKDFSKQFLKASYHEDTTDHSKLSRTNLNGSQSTDISSSIDVPGTYKNSTAIGNADITLDRLKSESSSVYSYHPIKNTIQPKVIHLDNLGETLGECNHMRDSSQDEKNLVLSKRNNRSIGHKGHKISQSVDLDIQKGDIRRRSEKVSTFNGQARSKSLTRRFSLQTAVKNINNIENETFKKHSRNSSIGKSLKKMLGIHSK